jgi:hypothetical protein
VSTCVHRKGSNRSAVGDVDEKRATDEIWPADGLVLTDGVVLTDKPRADRRLFGDRSIGIPPVESDPFPWRFYGRYCGISWPYLASNVINEARCLVGARHGRHCNRLYSRESGPPNRLKSIGATPGGTRPSEIGSPIRVMMGAIPAHTGRV